MNIKMLDYKLSRFIQIIKYKERIFVYNSLYNNPSIISKDSYDLLKLFSISKKTNKKNKLRIINKTHFKKQFKQFLKLKYITNIFKDERTNALNMFEKFKLKYKPGKYLDSLTLKLTNNCNLKCGYCISNKFLEYSSEKNDKYLQSKMSFKTAKKAIDIYILNMKRKFNFKKYISFGGGEALLNFQVLKRILEYCQKKFKNQCSFRLNTNLTLAHNDILKTLLKYNVKFSTSLDGIKYVNDKIRKQKDNKGTYELIVNALKNIEILSNKKHNQIWTVITEDNFDEINENYLLFLKNNLGIKYLTLQPDITDKINISSEMIASKLFRLYKFGKKNEIEVDGFWLKPFINIFENSNGNKMFMCKVGKGSDISIMPNGDISVCTYSNKKIGHIDNFEQTINSDEYKNFIFSRYFGNIKECFNCEIEGACMGGCYLKHEFSNVSKIRSDIYQCEINKIITKKLILNKIAEMYYGESYE